MPRSEATWSKFKSSYMWGNKEYYLRRTKFAVYQLATTNVNIITGIGVDCFKDYNGLSKQSVPGFPDARIKTPNFVPAFAFNLAAALLVAVVFAPAVFFELFWPEREESPLMQWISKLSAAFTALCNLAAAAELTAIVVTSGVKFSNVTAEQEAIIRANWDGPKLDYKNNWEAWATVGFDWLEVIFVIWSTTIMWRSYSHNNKYGPFKDHIRKDRLDSRDNVPMV